MKIIQTFSRIETRVDAASEQTVTLKLHSLTDKQSIPIMQKGSCHDVIMKPN
jgi:hypothetical protein